VSTTASQGRRAPHRRHISVLQGGKDSHRHLPIQAMFETCEVLLGRRALAQKHGRIGENKEHPREAAIISSKENPNIRTRNS